VTILRNGFQDTPSGIRRKKRTVSVSFVNDTAGHAKLLVDCKRAAVELDRFFDIPDIPSCLV
jgi:hypothetical protein